MFQRLSLGRTRRTMKKGEGIVQISCYGSGGSCSTIIAEIRYGPFIWNFFPILYAIARKLKKKSEKM
jgi:hypothetical protein